MSEKLLNGIVPAVITPLNESGNVDLALFEKQITYLSEMGVHGFFISGTTGEGPYLSQEESVEIFKVARRLKKSKQFLCAACIMPSTEQTIQEIRYFEKLEPDFTVAVAPFYYSVSQESLVEHFNRIASSSPVPVIVYNIPQRTHNKIEYDTVIQLSNNKNIAGIKDSSGDFVTFSRWCYSNLPGRFSVVQGEDYLDAPSLIIGAGGIVTGLGNVWIEPYIEMWNAMKRGDWNRVRQMQSAINKLYDIIVVAGGKVLPAIKAACYLLGRSTIFTKIEGEKIEKETLKKIEFVLKDLKLL